MIFVIKRYVRFFCVFIKSNFFIWKSLLYGEKFITLQCEKFNDEN